MPTFTNVPSSDRRFELYARDAKPSPSMAKRRTAVGTTTAGARLRWDDNLRENLRARFEAQVATAARDAEIDPALIHAVISAESGYNPMARSPRGALGLMQLMPQTAARYRVANPFDPAQNIHGGTRYLRDLLQMFNNDLRLAIAAYNAGENAVMKYGNRIPPYPETIAYVPRVLQYYQRYGGRHGAARH